MERGASLAESVKWDGFDKHQLTNALKVLFITFGGAAAYTLLGTWLPVVQVGRVGVRVGRYRLVNKAMRLARQTGM